jgi:hypothetical protein
MTSTYTNDDGVLVVVAGPVVLESVSDAGEPVEKEDEADDVVRDIAGQ